MYLGIDLGTSNSAIVGNSGGELRHFKTPEGTDVLPSAIMVDRRGGMLVGKRAYDQAAFSPESIAQGFKRLMGTSSPIRFANGTTITPEEASCEVIKALLAQARMSAGDFNIEGAVVTIPAAFNQMQFEATMRAAANAGLSQVALLQEPIAAAMASIARSSNKNGQFLVYDLGGGTFDAAIVQTISGSATVIAHAGINMLGGRDFDRAIVNSIVRPWLLTNFSLADDFQREEKHQRLIRVAHYRAEMSKIALSTQTQDRIFADESQIGARDRNGADIYLDVEIDRSQLEAIVVDEVDRSIELCRSLIKDAGYGLDDIDRIVLIGGPSRMPIVRERIASRLGLRVDLDTDPMTSVAVGAAIFAESREWTKDGASPKGSRAVAKVSDVRFDYPARVSSSNFRLRIRVEDSAQLSGSRLQLKSESGWASGNYDLQSTTEIRDIPLAQRGVNRFIAEVADSKGATTRTDILVFRSDASAAGMPMTHNLAVKILDNTSGIDQNKLHTLVKRGTVLPKRGAEQFRASKDLRFGNDDYLDFEVYEQADDVFDPSLNLAVGGIRIHASDLAAGDIIRRGDPVIIHWSIDENGLFNCKLEFSKISQTYETGKMYVSAEGHRSYDGSEGQRLASESLMKAREDVDGLERALGADVSEFSRDLRSRMGKLRGTLELATDADTRRTVSEDARLVRQEVARIRNRPEFIRNSVRSDIDQFIEGFALSVSSVLDERTNTQVQRLAALARDALTRPGPHSIVDAQRSLDEARSIVFSALAKLPDFWVVRFESLAEDRESAIDKQLHDDLVRQGAAALQNNDPDTLREITFRLSDNKVVSSEVGRGEIPSGITRD
ncbi:Hsp70 family protein [Bradyrhizobium acaciae]|uniref:Hsp70 family protein n=1 Tax=Bradyrhizobium acaciae TaxID=2683706 RepID=UPI001E444540|nr:Hsp70 family protein [Bradyrhizobium acaciae]MCC8978670.1 Hsp70 family protein [Bradyrhizobium acaciae]